MKEYIAPYLTGKTVLIVGADPDTDAAAVAAINADYVIASSRGLNFAPHADMLVAIDGNLPIPDYAGLRVAGVPLDDENVMHANLPYEMVSIDYGYTVHIRNNTLSAIRLAAYAGAANIILAGISHARYDGVHAGIGFTGAEIGLNALIAELAGQGISVTYFEPPAKKKK